MKTRTEAENYVITTLGDYVDEHDVDAIIDEVYDYLGHYDFDQLDTDEHMDYEYWEVVKKHGKPDQMDIIKADRAAYLTALAHAEELKRKSDDSIRAGIKDGYTMYAISKALHMSPQAVAQIRDAGKK